VAGYAVGALKAVNEAMKETIGFDLTEIMRANTFDGKTSKNISIDMKGNAGEEVVPGISVD
jgi:flotillin